MTEKKGFSLSRCSITTSATSYGRNIDLVKMLLFKIVAYTFSFSWPLLEASVVSNVIRNSIICLPTFFVVSCQAYNSCESPDKTSQY